MADETVTVELGGDASGLAASADAAAAAVSKLDATSSSLGKTVDGLKQDYKLLEAAARDATDPETFLQLRAHADKAASAISKMEKELEKIEGEKAALTGVAKAEEKIGDEADAAAKDARQLDSALEDVGENESGMDALASSFASFAGNILAKATEKVVEFGVEAAKAIAAATIEADRSKRAAKGLLETYEGADAAAAHYEKLGGLAKKLGVDVNAITADFVEFNKKAGLSEAASVALIKLKADVEAIAPGTGRAEEATARFIELVKSGIGTESAIKQVADEFHVAGTGADAAAAKLKSPSAALDALKQKGTDLAAQLATKLGPKIIETADKFAAWADKPETIAAIEKAADATMVALDLLVPTIEVVTAALDSTTASSTGVAAAGGAVRGVVQALIAPLVGAYEAAVLVVDGFGRFTEAQQVVIGAVDGAIEAVTGFVGDWTQAGADLVAGFVQGIKDGIADAVAQATALADAATSAVKGALDSHSPSRVFEDIGGDVTAGFAQGLEPVDVAAEMKIPDAIDAANDNTAGAGASAGASSSGGASIVIEQLNITINGGNADAAEALIDEIARAASRRGLSLRMTGRAA